MNEYLITNLVNMIIFLYKTFKIQITFKNLKENTKNHILN